MLGAALAPAPVPSGLGVVRNVEGGADEPGALGVGGTGVPVLGGIAGAATATPPPVDVPTPAPAEIPAPALAADPALPLAQSAAPPF
jgi:hypothetical protein